MVKRARARAIVIIPAGGMILYRIFHPRDLKVLESLYLLQSQRPALLE